MWFKTNLILILKIKAAFWATNPNNTYEHNYVAGSTHFGFWYNYFNIDQLELTFKFIQKKI